MPFGRNGQLGSPPRLTRLRRGPDFAWRPDVAQTTRRGRWPGHDGGRRRHRSRTDDGDPAHGHRHAEARHEGEDGDRCPLEYALVGDQVHDPDAKPAYREHNVAGNNGDRQPSRRGALKVRVILDQPDREQIESGERCDDPRDKSENRHENPPRTLVFSVSTPPWRLTSRPLKKFTTMRICLYAECEPKRETARAPVWSHCHGLSPKRPRTRQRSASRARTTR